MFWGPKYHLFLFVKMASNLSKKIRLDWQILLAKTRAPETLWASSYCHFTEIAQIIYFGRPFTGEVTL